MEIKDIGKNMGIIGIISSYKSSLNISGTVSNLNIKDINNALKIVGLDEAYVTKKMTELTNSELFKVELATKLDNDIIVIGDMYSSLNYKDREFIKKLLIKLYSEYRKKIVVIDNNVESFINLTSNLFVIKNKKIIYETKNLYDDELYKYVRMPKIIEFIKYVNKDKKILSENTDIYELIKDIYRVVS